MFWCKIIFPIVIVMRTKRRRIEHSGHSFDEIISESSRDTTLYESQSFNPARSQPVYEPVKLVIYSEIIGLEVTVS